MKANVRPSILLFLLLAGGGALSDSLSNLLPANDWSVTAVEAERAGKPILILFSSRYCGYCDRLKSEVLGPQSEAEKLGSIVLIRELDIQRGGKILDFDGEKIRTRIFVNRYGIYATPTLLLVDSQGSALSAPVVGYNNAEDYTRALKKLLEALPAAPQFVSARLELPRAPGSF